MEKKEIRIIKQIIIKLKAMHLQKSIFQESDNTQLNFRY